jgi:PRC-barrel domain
MRGKKIRKALWNSGSIAPFFGTAARSFQRFAHHLQRGGAKMAMQQQVQPVATDETTTLISSDKVEGTPVYNRNGEKLGTIHSLMIDKLSGEVAYAVMSFGGFLGIGDSYHPLPWDVLGYDVGLSGYVVDLDRSMLEGAPTYNTSEMPNWGDRRWSQRVDEYYGVRR